MPSHHPPTLRSARFLFVLAALAPAALLSTADAALAQMGGEPTTPEDLGEEEGRVDGRRKGIEVGQDLGRSQAFMAAWLRGFRRGVTAPETWRLDDSRDRGLAEGSRPGRAAGLESGRAAGREGCAAAFLRLQGRPAYRTQAPPEPPPPPEPPGFEACIAPAQYRLRFPHDRYVEMSGADCERRDSPLGWDVPEPDYPDRSYLRERARLDGMNDEAVEDWVRGYKTEFRTEHDAAFRQQRDSCPAGALREWEDQGLVDGRREGARRRACDNFLTGFSDGWREGFDEGFARGWDEGWAEADQVHVENPVVRIESADLLDESGDGVVEPGEGVRLAATIANAGLRDAEARPLVYEGIVSVAARGAVEPMLPAQARRDERIDLGRADAAPFGASVQVRLRGLNGDERLLETTISRPVILDGATARLDVADSRLVARVMPQVRSIALKAADRDLRVTAGEASVALGLVLANERRDPELLVPVAPSALASPSSGDVELRSGNDLWMRRTWRHDPQMGDSIRVASLLPAGSRDLDDALTALSRRLQDELTRALDDPKLYRRFDDATDLAQLGKALPSLPPAVRPLFEQRLAAPLLARAEAKGTPRKVRKDVREALGRD